MLAYSSLNVPFCEDSSFFWGIIFFESSTLQRFPFSFGHFPLRKFPFPPIAISIRALSSSKVPLCSKFQFHLGTFISQSSLFLLSSVPFGHFLLRKFLFAPSFNSIRALSAPKVPFFSDCHFHSGTFVFQSSYFLRLPFPFGSTSLQVSISFGHFHHSKFPFPSIPDSIRALSSFKVPLCSKYQFHSDTFISQSSSSVNFHQCVFSSLFHQKYHPHMNIN